MRIDAAERFAFSVLYGNTEFRTKTQSTFRTKKVDSPLLVKLHWSIQNSSCTFNVPMFWQVVRHSWRLANNNWFWPQSLMRHHLFLPFQKAGCLLTVYCRDVLSRLEEVKAYITSTFGSVLKINSTKKVKYYKRVKFISIVIFYL